MESKGAVEKGSRTLEHGHEGGSGESSIVVPLTRFCNGQPW